MDRLRILAGSNALSMIRDEGLKAERVAMVTGPAGGPKWLVLYHMDRSLFSEFFAPRPHPLFLVGASSGAWRFAALAQKNPLEALERFRRAYVHQTYETAPTPEEVTQEAVRILSDYLNDGAVEDILGHPWMRLGILAVRAKYFAASENPYLRGAGLAVAAFHNILDRRLLALSFDRTLFLDGRDDPRVFFSDGIPLRKVGLSMENLSRALLASGTIPLVMVGVRDIPGAPTGCYLDGGVVDYHVTLEIDSEDASLVLMPHYIDRIVPGWLDKKLPWRKPVSDHLRNLVLIAPTREFSRSLPGGKIPDRTDFKTFFGKDTERITLWESATEACRCLGEELMEWIASGKIRKKAQPLIA